MPRNNAHGAEPEEPEQQALTGPQKALLARVRAEGTVVLNGRAARTVEALQAAGLVRADWDLVLHANGPGTWRITVSCVPAQTSMRCLP